MLQQMMYTLNTFPRCTCLIGHLLDSTASHVILAGRWVTSEYHYMARQIVYLLFTFWFQCRYRTEKVIAHETEMLKFAQSCKRHHHSPCTSFCMFLLLSSSCVWIKKYRHKTVYTGTVNVSCWSNYYFQYHLPRHDYKSLSLLFT